MDPLVIGIVAAFLLFDVVVFGGLWFLAAYSKANRPDVVNRGTIPEVTGKPNCVSTLSRDPARRVEPIAYTGEDSEAWSRLVMAIEEIPKSNIITNEAPYLYAEIQTPLFGFTDDIDIKQDREEKVFHLRSASRVGHSDLGANRKRVEELRNRFSEL